MINEIMILGVIISIAFYEITEISPGGLIVPACFAFYLDSPVKIILTVFISLLTFILLKTLSRYTIIYGRRRFAVCIILSFLIKMILTYFHLYVLNINEIYFLSMNGIGIIVPGILAQEIDKNGPVQTVSSLIILSVFIKALFETIYHNGWY